MGLERTGGFGLFQFFAVFFLCMLRNCGNPIMYMLAFLVMPQKYECLDAATGLYSSCDAETVICPALAAGQSVEYRVDANDEHYMENWQQQMGLECTPIQKVYLFAVCYYVTFAIGGFLTFPVIDKLGRRKTSYIFGLGNIFAVTIIMFCPTYTARVVGYCMLGFTMPQKNSLTYAWLFELMNQRYKVMANTCLNMTDFATMLATGIYFMSTPNWFPLFMTFYVLAAVGFVGVILFCPESPKWLLLQGRQKEAIRVLNYMASVNRMPDRISEDTEFIEAVVAQNLQNTEAFNNDQTIDEAVGQVSLRAIKPFE